MQRRFKPKPRDSAPARWPHLFNKKRNIVDLPYFNAWGPFLEVKKDLLDAAFETFESSVPSWDLAVVRQFFNDEQSNGLKQRSLARARLDDRDSASRQRRLYNEWLDASELEQALSMDRFNSVDHPGVNADRRLVYVYGLSMDYVVALAKTASYNQMSALRDAICKHVDAQTCIRIHIPVDGVKTFQLDFHVPFPTLRCAHGSSSSKNAIGAKPWYDVSFLGLKCHKDDETCRWTLYETNVSVVVWGWDHYRWIGWAFSNTLSDPTDRDGEEPSMEEDTNMEGESDMEEEVHVEDTGPEEDHFATDGNGPDNGRLIDADDPIWDPREYWLRIVNFRMSLIYKEWEWLVRNIAQRMGAWIREQDIVLAGRFKSREAQERAFDWLTQAMRLLGRLNERISAIMHIWTMFSAQGGHIEYLSEMKRRKVKPMINTLKETFEGLANLDIRLKSLQSEIGSMKTTLTLGMERENNCMAFDSRAFTRETNRLSLEMAEVNRDVLKLNRTSTNAAVETGRFTRTNIQLFVIITPFALALQYFGADKDIFHFERNTKTFSIAICILFCIFPILICMLNTINHGWEVFRQKRRLKGGKGPDEQPQDSV